MWVLIVSLTMICHVPSPREIKDRARDGIDVIHTWPHGQNIQCYPHCSLSISISCDNGLHDDDDDDDGNSVGPP